MKFKACHTFSPRELIYNESTGGRGTGVLGGSWETSEVNLKFLSENCWSLVCRIEPAIS